MREETDSFNFARNTIKNRKQIQCIGTIDHGRRKVMKESMLESAKEHIPDTKLKEDKKWMTSESLDLMEERRKAKADEQKYRDLDKQVKKRYNEEKEHWINT